MDINATLAVQKFKGDKTALGQCLREVLEDLDLNRLYMTRALKERDFNLGKNTAPKRSLNAKKFSTN